MSYVFTPAQQTTLTMLFEQGPQPNQNGNFFLYYQNIASILRTPQPSNGGLPPDFDPVVYPSRLWFEGATFANAGVGAPSTLIRGYTQTQGLMHFGRQFTVGTGPGGLQEGSNAVARNIHGNFLNPLPPASAWEVPAIQAIAAQDAVAVGNALFAPNIPNDTATTNNAAWAGSVLFQFLGNDQTRRLVQSTLDVGDTTADTMDDWRNLLFAQHAFEQANAAVLRNSFADQLDSTWFEIYYGVRGDLSNAQEAAAYAGIRAPAVLPSVLRGSVIEDDFLALGSLPVERSLDLLRSGYTGSVRTGSTAALFTDQARDFLITDVGRVAGQTLSTQYVVPGVLVTQAQNPANLEQRQALESLSPYVVSGGATVPPPADLAQLSTAYLDDRAAMLDTRLRYDESRIAYGTSTIAPLLPILENTQWTDVGATITLGRPDGAGVQRVVFGSTQGESLNGAMAADRLYGRAGGDTLSGGAGDDRLEGGNGSDTYQITAGTDRIRDSDGLGTVFLNGVQLTGGSKIAGPVWRSADQRFEYVLSEAMPENLLLVRDLQNAAARVEIENYQFGSLGIVLSGGSDPNPGGLTVAPEDTLPAGRRDRYDTSPANDLIRAGLREDYVEAGGGNDLIFGGGDNDRMFGGAGIDAMYGEAGKDYLIAGPEVGDAVAALADADVVQGSADTDLLAGGIGDDILLAMSSSDDPDAASTEVQGDWLVGHRDNDLLLGSTDRDFLNGGAGADRLIGGGSLDVLLGDGEYDFTVTSLTLNVAPIVRHTYNTGTMTWSTATATETFGTANNAFIFTLGVSPAGDFVFTPTTARPPSESVRVVTTGGGSDTLSGGSGDDWLAGQVGADTLFGDAGADILYGDDFQTLSALDSGNDLLFGGPGNDQLFGNAGDDLLDGGEGNDRLSGDDDLVTGGSDRLFGGPGVDELLGGGGNDILDAGDGDDIVVSGDGGDDNISGGAGNDVLQGDGPGAPAGNDILRGGEGNDTLRGNDGNDQLSGEAGNDQLLGEGGNDTLLGGSGIDQLNGGDGNDTYVLRIGEDRAGSVLTSITDSSGTDRVELPAGVFPSTLRVQTVGSDAVLSYGAGDSVRIVGGAGGGVIEQFVFFDGQVISLPLPSRVLDGLVQTKGIGGTDLLFRSGFEVELFVTPVEVPTAFADRLVGTASNDTIDGLEGDDLIYGQEGQDQIAGNNGNDLLDGGRDADIVSGGAGDDRMTGGDGADTLAGDAGADQLFGGAGDDQLDGGNDSDQLDGGAGVDLLRGGAGSDVYLFFFEEDTSSGTLTTIEDADNGNSFRFPEGFSLSEVRAIQSGNDYLIEFGNSRIRIKDENLRPVVDKFEFFDRAQPATLSELPVGTLQSTQVQDVNTVAGDDGLLAIALLLSRWWT